MRWMYLGAGTNVLQKNKMFATAGIRNPNPPVCSQVTKPTDRTSTRRGNYIVSSYMEGGTDEQARIDGYAFSSHIFKNNKITTFRILSFDLSCTEISHLEDLEVNRRVILKCTLKEYGA